jgi:DNA polymerase-3 subunit delta
VFALVDAVLKGRVGRARRILGGLRAEGVAPPVVLWALSREIRVVASIAWDMRGDQGPERAMQAWRQGLSGQPQKKLWDRRAPLIRQALARHNAGRWRDLLRCCGRVDRIIKGRLAGEPWDALLGLCTGMAGMPGLSGKMQTCL